MQTRKQPGYAATVKRLFRAIIAFREPHIILRKETSMVRTLSRGLSLLSLVVIMYSKKA